MKEALQKLRELFSSYMKDSEKTEKLVNQCRRNATLRVFYLKHLQKSFYRNQFLFYAIKNEETLIGIIKKFALLLNKSNQPGDKVVANWVLWFVKKATDLESRNYYRHLFDKFHVFCKENYPNAVGEFSGRIKSFCSFFSKILESKDTASIRDIFAFRFVLRANNHESEAELITSLHKMCKDFIKFCEARGISVIPSTKPKDTNFTNSKHPDVVLATKADAQILSGYYVKNYTYTPKEDGYQSIHLVLESPYGPFEVQFRTQKMHIYAEEGPAAHDKYKDKPLYEFYKELSKEANPDINYTNFIGLTSEDNIYSKKLRHSDALESSIPSTVDGLSVEEKENHLDIVEEILNDSSTII